MKAKQIAFQLINELPLNKIIYILSVNSTDLFDGIFTSMVKNYGQPNSIETLQGLRDAIKDRIQQLYEIEVGNEIEFEYPNDKAYDRITTYTPWKNN